jgi:hypothetical protein
MSEVALLSFGCAVSFLVVAAVYIFATEDFERESAVPVRESRSAEADVERFSKAA